MRLGILVTNTDESAFAGAHPKDGEKFPALMHLVRPEWTFAVFIVKDGEFPDNFDGLDGLILTGSPASVHGRAPWVTRLLGLIRQADRQKVAMFGACFGHQAIALALGGKVTRNPEGWVHGLIANRLVARRPWMAGLRDVVNLYGSHVDIVSALPDGAEVLATSQGCDVAGFGIANRIYTTQHHPEMTPRFIAALTEELAGDLGPDLATRARVSLSRRADTDAFADSIAAFFEQART